MWYTVNNRRALDEIVFRGRNKAYGAYVLRTEYEKTLFRALFLVMLGVTFFFSSAWLITRETTEAPVDTGQVIVPVIETIVDMRELMEKKEKSHPPMKKIEPPPPSNNNRAATLYTVASDDTSQKDSINDTPPEPVLMAGTGSLTLAFSTGGNKGNSAGDTTGSGKIFENYAADMPEFEGGISALRRFIINNIKYPESEPSMNSGGRAVIRFVVDEKGNISSATVKHSAGVEFDNEALRVVKMLPPFKTPGKMGGHPVKVYYELPIRFK